MHSHLGALSVDSIAAERPKFTAPMLLVHGLWCSAAVWRPFMGYFAHRGWTCHALNLRGHDERRSPAPMGAVRLIDYVEDVRTAMRACEAAPVVVGHDLGALLALHVSEPPPRAIVALAPLVPPLRNRAFGGIRSWLAMRRSGLLPVPGRRSGLDYLAHSPPGGMRSESGRVGRELRAEDFTLSFNSGVPTLVLAGERDRFTSPQHVERLARLAGATFRSIAGVGHGLPWEPGWEQRVSEIHRWLIQTLGADLLALSEDDEM